MRLSTLLRFAATILAVLLALNSTAQEADDIVIGQTSALSGILAELGQANTRGSQAYFDYVNALGGVNGRKIRIITLDDRYDTDKAVANVKQLIEQDKALALFGIVGIPANLAIMPLIAQAGIPNFAPYTGSDVMRTPHNRLVFNVRASYSDEIDKIVEHLDIRGIKQVGVAFQNNAFGSEGLALIEQALAKRKLRLAAKAGINNDSSNVEQAVSTLAEAKVHAVVLITVGKPSIDFIKSYNKRQQGTQFFALSVMASQSSINALGKDGVGVIVSQVSPFPFSATSSLVREYQRVMKKMDIKEYSYASMEGYLNAKIFTEALRRAGRNISRDSLIASLEGMSKVDFDGYLVNFSKANHQGSHQVELTVISKDGKFLR